MVSREGAVGFSCKIKFSTGETLEKFLHSSLLQPILQLNIVKMPFLSPEPTTRTQRALATVEAFIQASNCLEFTKNPCLF
jgi:hypothetical protein